MMKKWPGKLCLHRQYLLLAIPPVAIVFGGDLLLQTLQPLPVATRLETTNIPHGDAAARLRLLAAFLLVAGAASAAALYFVRLLRMTNSRDAMRTIGAFLIMVLAGILFYKFASLYEMQEKLSNQIHCGAATVVDAVQAGAVPVDDLDVRRDTQVYHLATPRDEAGNRLKDNEGKAVPVCGSTAHGWLRSLVVVESVLIGAGVPALVFGAILCLCALPESRPLRTDRLSLVKRQIRRLNTILYLAAFLLVAGILFAQAYYYYPLFALPGDQAQQFKAHAEALIIYHAVNHSLLIASFYIPAAALLLDRAEEVPVETDLAQAKSELMAPMQLVKAALAIFAPLLAGFLPEAVKLI